MTTKKDTQVINDIQIIRICAELREISDRVRTGSMTVQDCGKDSRRLDAIILFLELGTELKPGISGCCIDSNIPDILGSEVNKKLREFYDQIVEEG